MSRLTYLMNVSLDGYVETPDRGLEWAQVDDELHAWFNERERASEASLYGRRIYEVMAAFWPTAGADPAATPVIREFARIWNAKPKIVFSSTLEQVVANCRLERGDPVAALARLRAEFPGGLDVAGPTLASAFVRRDLVDRYHLVVHPVILGAGTRYLPPLERRIDLRLVGRHDFASGAIALEYERR
ncbi:MAG: hypothetical protein RL338_1279 [Chloroflexota bacterium]